MGIFDVFTGASAKKAADQNAAVYQNYGRQADQLLGQGQNIYSQFGKTGDDYLTSYGGQAQARLQGGLTNALGAYDAGTAAATGAARQAIDAYAPLGDLGAKYGRGSTLYQDALGINGAEGVTRAQGAFQTGPGYQFAVDEATNAAARKAAALGLAGSGNALDEIRQRAQGVASQEYGGYLDRLGGFIAPELQATSGAAAGRAAGYGNLADIYGADAAARAGLYTGEAEAQAGLLTNLGAARTGLAGEVAKGRTGLLSDQVNVAGNVASGQANANTAAAQAQQQGSAAFWNGLLNLGGTVAKAAIPGSGLFKVA